MFLGEMNPGETKNPGHEERIPPAGGGRLLSGGQLESAFAPVDDVHQARSTWGVEGWG